MIHVAKKGEEELEAQNVSRRGFLSFLVKGAAAAAIPKKTYVFFGSIYRPAPRPLFLQEDFTKLILAGGAFIGAVLLGSPRVLGGK